MYMKCVKNLCSNKYLIENIKKKCLKMHNDPSLTQGAIVWVCGERK